MIFVRHSTAIVMAAISRLCIIYKINSLEGAMHGAWRQEKG